MKTANTLNYSVLTVGVLLIFIASSSTVQFSCNMLTIIHFMLALKYLLSISVKKLQEKWLFKKKKKSDEKVQFLR